MSEIEIYNGKPYLTTNVTETGKMGKDTLMKTITAKPILKWAGGKSQLIEKITKSLPDELLTGKLIRYAEPFIGGGAIFFHIAQNYPVQEAYISDQNHELVVLYTSIQKQVENVIQLLSSIQANYFCLSPEQQKEYFYNTRQDYNRKHRTTNYEEFAGGWIERTAQMIFLNRTCYNGLFRVNSKGEFNVPFGDYKNPRICDEENLKAVSQVLRDTIIKLADFTECESFVDKNTFVYFDPPYRPISKTASFTAYSKNSFDDKEQTRLAGFFRELDTKGAKLMLSNSDPKNINPEDDFFDCLYAGYNIQRVSASRMINSKASKRGSIYELLITNYPAEQ
jgi:DNA adenine methylase